MEIVCVYNPVAGKGHGASAARDLAERLRVRGHGVRLLRTLPDAAAFRERCRDIQSGARVVCIGGDGTLQHFINACECFDGLAFWGIGTTNVMSRELGIPRRPDAFVRMVEHGRRLSFLPGVTGEGRKFLMMYSNGIDAHILSLVSQRAKNRLGRAAFLIPALRALWTYRYPTLRLASGAERITDARWVIVTRIKRYAGSFIVAREADPESGSLRVVVLRAGGFLPTLAFFLAIVLGRPERNQRVRTFDTRELSITCPDDAPPGQLDGDLLQRRVSIIRVADRPIPLLVPRRKA